MVALLNCAHIGWFGVWGSGLGMFTSEILCLCNIHVFYQISLAIRKNNYYPPGSKSEALRLGVHLILLYFIRISLLYPKTFFYLEGGRRTFLSLNLLIIIWFIVYV